MLFQSETVTVEKDRDGSAFLKIDVPGQTHNVITRRCWPTSTPRSTPSPPSRGCRCWSSAAASQPASSPAPTCTASSKSPTPPQPRRCRPRPTAVRQAGRPADADAGRHPRPLPGRRPGTRPGLRLPPGLRQAEHAARPAGSRLGLLPGWGGTQRLPRVVGLERALEIILQGKRLRAREALEAGAWPTWRRPARRNCGRSWRSSASEPLRQGKRPLKGLPLRTWRQRLLESTASAGPSSSGRPSASCDSVARTTCRRRPRRCRPSASG